MMVNLPENKNLIMKISLLILSFLLLLPAVYAQEKFSGEIYTLTFRPEQPVVSSEMLIDVGARNSGELENSYLLRVWIVKEGVIKSQEEYQFSLKPAKGIFFTVSYISTDIGEHEIIAKLYDKFLTEVYSTKILKFVAISEVGPFDIVVDPLSKVVPPGEELPYSLTILNMGKKGIDVAVRIEIPCPNEVISSEFVFFLGAESSLEKVRKMPVCTTQGLYRLIASILLLNRTFASSVTQFFVNETFLNLLLAVPASIEVKQGDVKSFDVIINNPTKEILSNIKLTVENLPNVWFSVKPESIAFVEPQNRVLFLVTFLPPTDATPKDYPIKFTVGSDKTISRTEAKLQVLEGPPTAEVPGLPQVEIVISDTLIYAAVGLISLVVVFLILKKRRSGVREVPAGLKEIREKFG